MPTNDDERDIAEERAQAQAVQDEQEAEAAAENEGPFYVAHTEEYARMHADRGTSVFDTREEADEFLSELRACRIWTHAELFPDEGPVDRKLRSLGFHPLTIGGIQGMAIEVPLGAGENPDVKALVVTALLGKILEQVEADQQAE